MPSKSHQWLVTWAIRKMAQDGFRPTAVDGTIPQDGARVPSWATPSTGQHKPDAVGYSASGDIALAEAKTLEDVLGPHTVGQLKDFSIVCSPRTGRASKLYVCVPLSAVRELDKVLTRAGLLGSPQVVRVHVPDILLVTDDV
jgi:hypothetical protein